MKPRMSWKPASSSAGMAAAPARPRAARPPSSAPIGRIGLDALEHHPGAAGLDPPDDLVRIEVDQRHLVRVLADRDLAGVVLDLVARQLAHQLDDARQREQRIAGELCLMRERTQRESRSVRRRCRRLRSGLSMRSWMLSLVASGWHGRAARGLIARQRGAPNEPGQVEAAAGRRRRVGTSMSAIGRRSRQMWSIIGWLAIGGGIDAVDARVGAEVARQLERELHAGRQSSPASRHRRS